MKATGSMLAFLTLAASVALMPFQSSSAAEKTDETRRLEARSVELAKDMAEVADGVYVAVGYSPSNISMIVGKSGVIFVDTGMSPEHAAHALASKDYQWAAQLSDYLISLAPEPKLAKADALTGLAENVLTATGRNYLLTVAMELRASANVEKVP
jgi:alkyl sulfatase BDS1-like metallo-beta-lactamase superfamily hydrolase